MRILYVTERAPCGVGEDFVYPEIDELAAQGHEVTLAPVRIEKGHRATSSQEVERWLPRSVTLPLFGVRTLRLALRQFALCPLRATAACISAVAASGMTRNGLRNLLLVPKSLALSAMVQCMHVDHIHAYWATQPATVANVVHRLTGVPWSFTGHRWDIQEERGLNRKLASARFMRCISEHGAQSARQRVDRNLRDRVYVIHVGVVINGAQPDRRRPPRHGSYRICTAANLVDLKGHRYLLEAISLLRTEGIDVEAHLYGEGPAEPSLKECVTALRLDGVMHFHGRVPHEVMLKEYRKMDVVVLPSLIEGIPVSLMEAMAAGVPVVATALDGTRELLGGGAGLTVPPRNPVALAKTIRELLMSDSLYHECIVNGWRRVVQAFDVRYTTEELVHLFEGGSGNGR